MGRKILTSLLSCMMVLSNFTELKVYAEEAETTEEITETVETVEEETAEEQLEEPEIEETKVEEAEAEETGAEAIEQVISETEIIENAESEAEPVKEVAESAAELNDNSVRSSAGDACAVLKDDGELVFFRSNVLYTDKETGTFTDIFGNDYIGTVYTELETRSIYDIYTIPWYESRESITSVKVADSQTIMPPSMRLWFANCNNLISVSLDGFDTSKVRDIAHLFQGCSSLTALDLSKIDTGKIIDCSYLLYGCRNLSKLDLNVFDTSCVTNMAKMFYGCNSLTEIDLSGFDTGNVTDMQELFSGCNSLTSLDISSFDTQNVTNMSRMFAGISLSSLDLSGIDTAKVTNMYEMFAGSNITTLDLGGLNTSNVTNMSRMFYMCKKLHSIDLSGLDTSNVANMSEMFYECISLSDIDLSGLNTGNVTNMYGMFRYCSCLESIDLTGFDTGNVTNMGVMFNNCESLEALDLSSFNTHNVTSMGQMFYQCSNLTTLDISSFDTGNVNGMDNMFGNCNSLMWIKLGDEFSKWLDNAYLPEGPWKNQDINLRLSAQELYNQYPANAANWAGEWRRIGKPYAVFTEEGKLVFFRSTNTYAYDNLKPIGTYSDLNGTEYTGHIYTGIETLTAASDNYVPWNPNRDAVTEVVFAEGQEVKPVSLAYWFCGFENIESIDVGAIDTSNVTDMRSMFYGCSRLTELDLSSFDTHNVINMRLAFGNCSSLKELDLSSFDTANVTDMKELFSGSNELESIKLGTEFTNWIDESYLPEGLWVNEAIDTSLTETELYDQYPANAAEYAGTWVKTVPPKDTYTLKYYFKNAYNEDITLIETREVRPGEMVHLEPVSIVSSDIAYFDGWWKMSASGSNKDIPADTLDFEMPESDVDIECVYDFYTVNLTLEGNGIEVQKEWSLAYLEDATVAPGALSAFQREGYRLAGWNTEADGSGEWYEVNSNGMDFYRAGCRYNCDVTLYAQWISEDSYLVTWKNEDGTVLKISSAEAGETPVYEGAEPEQHDPEGIYTYTFAGWTPEVHAVEGDATYTAVYTRYFDHEDPVYVWKKTETGYTVTASAASKVKPDYAETESADTVIVLSNADTGAGTYTVHFENEIFEDQHKEVIASGMCGDHVAWDQTADYILTIGGEGDMYDYTSNNSPWKKTGYAVTSLEISQGVTKIGNYAFDGCNFEKVELPEGITVIGDYAFSRSGSYLKTVILPESLIEIGSYAFYPDRNLSEVTFKGNNLKTINGLAFYYCTSLEQIDLPDSVEYIGFEAFCESGLKEFRVPDSAYNWGFDIILNCSSLEKLIISENCSGGREGMLANNNLESHPNLVEIEVADLNQYFAGVDGVLFNKDMTKLIKYPAKHAGTTYVIPASVKELSTSAFEDAAYLEQQTIPANVEVIGQFAFRNCPVLNEVVFEDGVQTIYRLAFAGCTNLVSVTLPDSVNNYGYGVFQDCTALKTVDFGNTMTVIPDGMFKNTGLEMIEIPGRISTIKEDAFRHCSQLKKLVIEEGVTEIGRNAFAESENLEKVIIPSTVSTVGNTSDTQGVFYNCPLLKTAGPTGGDYNIEYSWTGSLPRTAFANIRSLQEFTWHESINNIGDYVFSICGFTNIEIPDQITSIGRGILRYNYELVSAVLPDHLTAIPEDTFYNCSKLENVHYPSELEEIGDSAFGNCSALNDVQILPENVKTIGDYSYYRTDSIRLLTLPATVTSIGKYNFNYGNTLTDIFYGGTEQDWNQIQIASTNTLIPSVDSSSAVTMHYNYYINKLNLNDFYIDISAEGMDIPAEIGPEKAAQERERYAAWSIEDSAIAEISDDDLIKGIQPGKTIIHASTENGLEDSCTVTVKGIRLSAAEAELEAGETVQLTADVYLEEDEDHTLTWTSSNPDIAKVDENGTVTAKSAGTAIITASAGGYSASAAVKVEGAYAVLTESHELVFFRSDETYSSGSNGIFTDISGTQYTGKVFAGVETLNAVRNTDIPWYSDRLDIRSVKTADGQIIKPVSTAFWFYGCENLAVIDLKGFDTSENTSMKGMFVNCRSLAALDLSVLDTHNVTDMHGMLTNCSGLTNLDLSGVDTGKVTIMYQMFQGCSSLTSLDLSGFDTANVTDMSYMFTSCSSLTKLDLSSFDTSHVTQMPSMFESCTSLESLDLSSFNTENVTYMSCMFTSCGLISIKLGEGFTKWQNDAYLPSGTWKNFEKQKSLTETELYEQYPANATDWAGTWVLDGSSADDPINIESVSLALKEKIEARFYVYVPDSELNTTDINLTFNGKTTTYHAADITPKPFNDKPCRIVSVATFAKQMRDDIKVTVTKTGTTDLKYLEYKDADVTNGMVFKIEDYVKLVEANSTNKKLIDLVHKMDNYGKYAQIQFNNYNRESFDEADPIPEDYDGSRLTPYLVNNVGSASGIKYTSGSLELESDTGLRVYYKLTGTDAISTYTFKVDGTKATPVKKGTQYYVSIKNIPARLMNKPHTVTVTDKAGNTLTTTYSGLSYPAAVLASDIAPESLKNLCRAIDLYAEAALAYFGE